jgi:hypothetical protein
MEDPDDGRISRRKALRRLGAASALVWSVPAIQSINMTKAWAQAGSNPPPPQGCGNARVSKGGGCRRPNFNPQAGCGGKSCLVGADPNAPSACGSVVSAAAADGADWTICIAEGCRIQTISMASAGACWNGLGAASCGGDATFNWTGFAVSKNCIMIHRPTATNPAGMPVTHDISHVDLVICCEDETRQ